MPVYKCAVGILFPRPNMQRVKGRKAETIGTLEIVEELSEELGRISRMAFIPWKAGTSTTMTGAVASL